MVRSWDKMHYIASKVEVKEDRKWLYGNTSPYQNEIAAKMSNGILDWMEGFSDRMTSSCSEKDLFWFGLELNWNLIA